MIAPLRVAAFIVTLAAVAACAKVIAPAPPSSMAAVNQEARVVGPRITVAARAARALNTFGFTTKRFGSDSTWGWRGGDRVAARFRYANTGRDSTRVSLELWGNCEAKRPCRAIDADAILSRLDVQDSPPGR
jgi:hypothetical protein